jgi:uncharacterized sulfatase
LCGIRFAFRRDLAGVPAMSVLAASLLALLASAATTAAAVPPAPDSRPNVLVIYTDDQARWGVGAYGNPEVVTPNLDRLAGSGARFLNAFTVTPVCSPSRAEMMTGRLGTQVSITDWINAGVEPGLGLSPAEVTWPERLRASGYDGILCGKWHLGERPEHHPTRRGYGAFFGFLGGGNRPIDPTLEVDGERKKLDGSLPDHLVDRAIAFIDAPRTAPFLVSVHFRAPHTPYAPVPEVDSAAVAALDPTLPDPGPGLTLNAERVKKITREYYASIHSVDRNVGRLLDHLDAKGLTDRTIVIFSSDHGYMIGHHGLWHKGNATWLAEGRSGPRPNMFEESIRVPLVVRWPGVTSPGQVIESVVSNLDLFPSILEMVGIGVPPTLRIHGRSFVPLLRGGAPGGWDDTLYGQYDMHHYKVARMRMVRTPEWKLIRHYEPDEPDELYHLATDPTERENLSGSAEQAEVRQGLERKLEAWMRSTGDPLARP